jgi:hypothetical protein
MNLLPFNKKSYQRLIELGYKYLLVKKRNPKLFNSNDNYADVQILKAIKDCDGIPVEDNCEPIESERINEILHQSEVVSFVIISDM